MGAHPGHREVDRWGPHTYLHVCSPGTHLSSYQSWVEWEKPELGEMGKTHAELP